MSENDKIIKCSSCCNPVEHCTCRNRELKMETNKPKADEIEDILYNMCDLAHNDTSKTDNYRLALIKQAREELAKAIDSLHTTYSMHWTSGECTQYNKAIDKTADLIRGSK
jgi:hypothetical protein